MAVTLEQSFNYNVSMNCIAILYLASSTKNISYNLLSTAKVYEGLKGGVPLQPEQPRSREGQCQCISDWWGLTTSGRILQSTLLAYNAEHRLHVYL